MNFIGYPESPLAILNLFQFLNISPSSRLESLDLHPSYWISPISTYGDNDFHQHDA